MAETEKTLEEPKNRSAISLLAAEEEINQLKKQLKSLQAQEESRHRNSDRRRSEKRVSERRRMELRGSEQRVSDLDKRSADKRNAEAVCDYEKQLRTLKDEIAVLSAEKSVLQGRSDKLSQIFSFQPLFAKLVIKARLSKGKKQKSARSRSPSPAPCSRSHSHSRSHSQSRSHSRSHSRSRSRSRSASPASAKARTPSPNRARLSSVARKAALLSRFSDAYSQGRLDAQCLLRRCIDKAETVQRIIYIATVDVIRAMNVNPKISFPPEVDFCLLSNFIQEICCIAFAMQTLEPPLDIAFGADGEIFNDCRYRRSYDSDFTAPLVFYHVWPALMENDCVIMKGEAVTKRGAFVRGIQCDLLFWRIWSFSYSFAQWKENCHFLVYDPHLPSFQICAK
ncbi:hypothetical protein Celaphus_00017507, partial [Cervus elaphus hippelaphus]